MKSNCLCNYCKTPLYRKPSYLEKHSKIHCNRACDLKSRVSGKIVPCSYCKKEIYKMPSSLEKFKNFYCSKSCHTSFKNKEKSTGENITPSIKKEVLSIHGLTCVNQKCPLLAKGIKFEPYFIDFDHIDGNRKNNQLSNLRPLCVLCHALKSRAGVLIKSKENGA